MSNDSENYVVKHRSLSNKNSVKCGEHLNSMSLKLKEFYDKEEFLDIVLIAGIDNFRVQAHRIILSASSDYFLALFRNNLNEPKPRCDVVEIKEIDGVTIKLILDFMYTASIELHSETVESVLRAANFFQMNSLIVACCDFIGERLDPGNCLGISLFAEQYNCLNLYSKSLSFAYMHFDKVCKGEEFFQLNEEQLTKFLSNDYRQVRSEQTLFLSLFEWAEYDKENRETLICKLLTLVRFTLVNANILIDKGYSMSNTMESKKLIVDWIRWHTCSPERRTLFPPEYTKVTRVSRLAYISADYENCFKVSIFNPKLNCWFFDEWPRPFMDERDFEYTTAVINNKLIMAGGVDSSYQNVTNSVKCLDLDTMNWTELAPMHRGRFDVGLVELDGYLYAIGGWDGEEWTTSVERYDFSTNEWQDVAPMSKSIGCASVTTLLGAIYANGQVDYRLERYDPALNKWTTTAHKNEHSDSFGICAVGKYLYAVGGVLNGKETKTVERYDPIQNSWTEVDSLKFERGQIKCVHLNNKLVACEGCYDGQMQTNSVEEYNPETKKWKTLAPLLSCQHMSSNLVTM